ncbi:hypothetical protein THIOM_002474 [Candidatus Thiomargarita nelsonii]|uniref:Uncharacterized protein n=1 Tax=Candidatus Thiomargarita nelsonii TaxID=1003181 RepID=A0A176S1E7_9GAMM|nr:hypothetical protein THIOM_002474 [Candidatus Thiomargarita nelsonii]
MSSTTFNAFPMTRVIQRDIRINPPPRTHWTTVPPFIPPIHPISTTSTIIKSDKCLTLLNRYFCNGCTIKQIINDDCGII